MGSGVKIEPGDWVELTFTAVTADWLGNPVPEGLYCNQVQVVPGGDKTTSGQTAPVMIGNPGVVACPVPAVQIKEVLTKHTLREPVTYPYAVDVEYTMYVENIGNVDVWIAEMINLLPVGIDYIANTCDITDLDCLTDPPFQVHYVSQVDRQRVTWKFNPTIPVAPDQTKPSLFPPTRSSSRVTIGSTFSCPSIHISRRRSIPGPRPCLRWLRFTPWEYGRRRRGGARGPHAVGPGPGWWCRRMEHILSR